MHKLNAISLALVLALVSLPGLAHAQPNPFDAYDRRDNPGGGDNGNGNTGNPGGPQQPAPKKATMDDMMRAGDWVFSARTALNLSFTDNDLSGGGTDTNSTTFFRLSPSIGYFLLDNFEVAFDIGVLSRSLSRGSGNIASEVDALFDVSARYHLNFTPTFGLMGGLSLGGYAGSSEREIEVTPDNLVGDPVRTLEETSTGGFATSINVMASYMIVQNFQLRLGVDFTVLVGVENISSTDESLSTLGTHFGLGFGTAYFF